MEDLTTRISDPDAFYAAVVGMHAGLSVEESLRLCARLILLLANEVGDSARLTAIFAAAVAPLQPGREPGPQV